MVAVVTTDASLGRLAAAVAIVAVSASRPRRHRCRSYTLGVARKGRLDGPVLGEVVLVLDELALAALGRAGLLLVAVETIAAAPLAAGAGVLPVALALHPVAGVARRAEEHRAAGGKLKHVQHKSTRVLLFVCFLRVESE